MWCIYSFICELAICNSFRFRNNGNCICWFYLKFMCFLFEFYINIIFKRNLKCYFLARLNLLLRNKIIFQNRTSKYNNDDIRRKFMAFYDIHIRIFWYNISSSAYSIVKYGYIFLLNRNGPSISNYNNYRTKNRVIRFKKCKNIILLFKNIYIFINLYSCFY